MRPAEYIDALSDEGTRLADTAARITLDSPVPTCPGWTLRDLLRHTGGVHRWAGEHVRNEMKSIRSVDDFRELVGDWPSDETLVSWYRGELGVLVESLRAAPADLTCAYFLKAESPLAFWTRRQAHEACIHRADVEAIAGMLTPVAREFALDGIDELLTGFVPRPFMKLRSPEPVSLCVAPRAVDRAWTLAISDAPVRVVDDRLAADCTVSGKASDIYFALWNRADAARLTISGQREVFDLFRTSTTIKWS